MMLTNDNNRVMLTNDHMTTNAEDWAAFNAAVQAALAIYDEWKDSVGRDKNTIQQNWREEWAKVEKVRAEAFSKFERKHPTKYYTP